jgi:hypothetical protein
VDVDVTFDIAVVTPEELMLIIVSLMFPIVFILMGSWCPPEKSRQHDANEEARDCDDWRDDGGGRMEKTLFAARNMQAKVVQQPLRMATVILDHRPEELVSNSALTCM